MTVPTTVPSFKAWLLSKVGEPTAIGDIAADASRDPRFPADPSPAEAIAYMARIGPLPEQIMRTAATAYRREVRST